MAKERPKIMMEPIDENGETAVTVKKDFWIMKLSNDRSIKVPAELDQDFMTEQREMSGLSEDEWNKMLLESYEELSDVNIYPILRVGKSDDEKHPFILLPGLTASDDEMAAVNLGSRKLFVIVVQPTTMASCYGDEHGIRTNTEEDKLRCLATIPKLINTRGDEPDSRMINPAVIFRTLPGDYSTCGGCPFNTFNHESCKETLAVMAIVYSPDVLVPELATPESPGGNIFPAMIRISPTGIGAFKNKSRNPEKAGYVTKVAALKRSMLFTVAELTIEKKRRGTSQKWGVFKWTPIRNMRFEDGSKGGAATNSVKILDMDVYRVMQAMALQMKASLRKSFADIKTTMKTYSQGEFAREDVEESDQNMAVEPGEDAYSDVYNDGEDANGEIPF